MKVTIKVEKDVELKTLLLKANVRYWSDATINGVHFDEDNDESDAKAKELMPCIINDVWMPEIEIETGKILNWEQGKKAEIHYKVCDGCGWELKDESGETVLSSDDGYVPDTLCPKENGYGDYIIMDIDENGQIGDWDFSFSDFQESED